MFQPVDKLLRPNPQKGSMKISISLECTYSTFIKKVKQKLGAEFVLATLGRKYLDSEEHLSKTTQVADILVQETRRDNEVEEFVGIIYTRVMKAEANGERDLEADEEVNEQDGERNELSEEITRDDSIPLAINVIIIKSGSQDNAILIEDYASLSSDDYYQDHDFKIVLEGDKVQIECIPENVNCIDQRPIPVYGKKNTIVAW